MSKRMHYRKRPLPPEDVLLDELRFLCAYNAAEGGFTWVNRRVKNQPVPGKRFGGSDGRGYVMCLLLGHKFKVHQLVWLWHHGELPRKPLDHINGIRSDNRIENLRECEDWQNGHNMRHLQDEASGYRAGNSGTYRAKIVIKGETIELGSFRTKEDARAAYVQAKRRHLGEFSPV